MLDGLSISIGWPRSFASISVVDPWAMIDAFTAYYRFQREISPGRVVLIS
jgi:hypothetical protein